MMSFIFFFFNFLHFHICAHIQQNNIIFVCRIYSFTEKFIDQVYTPKNIGGERSVARLCRKRIKNEKKKHSPRSVTLSRRICSCIIWRKDLKFNNDTEPRKRENAFIDSNIYTNKSCINSLTCCPICLQV